MPGTTIARTLSNLSPRQWQTVSIPVPTLGSNNFIVVVEYTAAGMRNVIAEPVLLGNSAGQHIGPLLARVLPGLVGILGTIVGVVVVAGFARQRESRRFGFEWSKFVFERFELQYRRFVRRTGGTLEPQQMKSYFEQLEDTALVTPQMRRSFKETLRKMESETDKKAKAQHRDSFLDEFLRPPSSL